MVCIPVKLLHSSNKHYNSSAYVANTQLGHTYQRHSVVVYSKVGNTDGDQEPQKNKLEQRDIESIRKEWDESVPSSLDGVDLEKEFRKQLDSVSETRQEQASQPEVNQPEAESAPWTQPQFQDQLMDTDMFKSSVVREEFESMMKEFNDLSKLQQKFLDFDVQGKRMYLEKMRGVADRMGAMFFRLRTSEEEACKQMYEFYTKQFSSVGMSMEVLVQQLNAQMESYEQYVQEEEAAGYDPLTVASRKEVARKRFGYNAVPDMTTLYNDPDFQAVLAHPEGMKAAMEMINSPGDLTVAKRWENHPQIGPFITKLVKYQLGQQMQ